MRWYDLVGIIALMIVSGFFTTVVVQILKQAKWSARIKQALAVAVSVLVGLATVWLAGDVLGLINGWGHLTSADVWAVMVSVYTAANIWYKSILQKAGFMDRLEKVGAPAG